MEIDSITCVKSAYRLHRLKRIRIIDLNKTSSIIMDELRSMESEDREIESRSSSPETVSGIESEGVMMMRGIKMGLMEYMTNYTKETPIIELMIKKRKATVCRTTKACYSHIACIYDSSLGEIRDIVDGKCVFGENSERKPKIGAICNTHAEIDAIKRYHGLLTSKRIKARKVNILVIRFNKSGNLCESAPCYHCSKKLNEDSLLVIDKLYYSRSDGSVSGIKFRDWMERSEFHLTRGWRGLMLK
jgi:hypothetical protein